MSTFAISYQYLSANYFEPENYIWRAWASTLVASRIVFREHPSGSLRATLAENPPRSSSYFPLGLDPQHSSYFFRKPNNFFIRPLWPQEIQSENILARSTTLITWQPAQGWLFPFLWAPLLLLTPPSRFGCGLGEGVKLCRWLNEDEIFWDSPLQIEIENDVFHSRKILITSKGTRTVCLIRRKFNIGAWLLELIEIFCYRILAMVENSTFGNFFNVFLTYN